MAYHEHGHDQCADASNGSSRTRKWPASIVADHGHILARAQDAFLRRTIQPMSSRTTRAWPPSSRTRSAMEHAVHSAAYRCPSGVPALAATKRLPGPIGQLSRPLRSYSVTHSTVASTVQHEHLKSCPARQ